MFRRKALALATLSTIVCISTAGAEEGFKSSKFLTHSAESQKGYIGASVMMAGVIASKNAPEQARCIDGWASSNDPSGFPTVIEAMRKYPDYHPSGIILAVLQKACGSFEFVRK